MTKWTATVICLLFFFFLMLPQIGLLFGFKGPGTDLESRKLNTFPKTSIKSILSTQFSAEFNAYIWDHLPLRAQLLSLDHWIDYHLFKDSPIPEKVLVGKNGWLFLYPTVMEWPTSNVRKIDEFIAQIQRADRLQTKIGKQIFIVPSPCKASIYPEFLNDGERKSFSRYAAVYRERLEKTAETSTSLLLLWKPFLEEKSRLLQQKKPADATAARLHYLYRPRDRHFSWETAILQAKCIVEKISPGMWQSDRMKHYLSPYYLSISEMQRRFLKIQLLELYTHLEIARYFEMFDLHLTTQPIGKTHYVIKHYTSGRAGGITPIAKHVVIVHDSFFDLSSFFLPPYFRETTFLHWNTMQNFSRFMKTLQKADILVFQSVEGQWHARIKHLAKIFDFYE